LRNWINNIFLLFICCVVQITLTSCVIPSFKLIFKVVFVRTDIAFILCELIHHKWKSSVDLTCLLVHFVYNIVVGQIMQMSNNLFRIGNEIRNYFRIEFVMVDYLVVIRVNIELLIWWYNPLPDNIFSFCVKISFFIYAVLPFTIMQIINIVKPDIMDLMSHWYLRPTISSKKHINIMIFAKVMFW
jgi:hypothetical protein